MLKLLILSFSLISPKIPNYEKIDGVYVDYKIKTYENKLDQHRNNYNTSICFGRSWFWYKKIPY